jgi:tRNA dimethylallyltransferase
MKKIIIIGGPTASYKSSLALELAKKNNGVIINADSIQVYFEIPILSSQPSIDEKEIVPHKLYSFVSGEFVYSVGKWLDEVVKEVRVAHEIGMMPIIVGGTGLYINSVINGLSKIPEIDPDLRDNIRSLYDRIGKEEFYSLLEKRDAEVASKLFSGDKHRVIRAFEVIEQTGKSILYWQQMSNFSPFEKESIVTIISSLPRDILYKRCNDRFVSMIEEGALDEVEYLNKNLPDSTLPITKALGVRELSEYLSGKISLVEAIARAQTGIRKFAKRQVTWFKNQTKDVDKIEYTSPDDFDNVVQYVSENLAP